MDTSNSQTIIQFFNQNPNHILTQEDAVEITNTLFSEIQDLDFISVKHIQLLQILTTALITIKNN